MQDVQTEDMAGVFNLRRARPTSPYSELSATSRSGTLGTSTQLLQTQSANSGIGVWRCSLCSNWPTRYSRPSLRRTGGTSGSCWGKASQARFGTQTDNSLMILLDLMLRVELAPAI